MVKDLAPKGGLGTRTHTYTEHKPVCQFGGPLCGRTLDGGVEDPPVPPHSAQQSGDVRPLAPVSKGLLGEPGSLACAGSPGQCTNEGAQVREGNTVACSNADRGSGGKSRNSGAAKYQEALQPKAVRPPGCCSPLLHCSTG